MWSKGRNKVKEKGEADLAKAICELARSILSLSNVLIAELQPTQEKDKRVSYPLGGPIGFPETGESSRATAATATS
jgi:hypothetical protein